MNKKLTIEDVVQQANEALSGAVESGDLRVRTEISVRRVRDYASKGLMPKPYGRGPQKWYGPEHVNALVELRRLQSSGLPEKYLQSTVSEGQTTGAFEERQRQDAIGFLESLSATSTNLAQSASRLNAATSMLSGARSAGHLISATQTQVATAQMPTKIWTEVEVGSGVFLKFDESVPKAKQEVYLNLVGAAITK
jgi:DNA-binding transcriptional MerR regulator